MGRWKALFGVISLLFALSVNAEEKSKPRVEAVPETEIGKEEAHPVKLKNMSKDVDTTDLSLIKSEKDCQMVDGKLVCKKVKDEAQDSK